MPEGAPTEITSIIRACISFDAEKRPSFTEIYPQLKNAAKSLNVDLD